MSLLKTRDFCAKKRWDDWSVISLRSWSSLWKNVVYKWKFHLKVSMMSLSIGKARSYMILLMEEILHQLTWRNYHYLQGFIHLVWCRISSINRFRCAYSFLDDTHNFDQRHHRLDRNTCQCWWIINNTFRSFSQHPEKLPHGWPRQNSGTRQLWASIIRPSSLERSETWVKMDIVEIFAQRTFPIFKLSLQETTKVFRSCCPRYLKHPFIYTWCFNWMIPNL